MQHHNPVGNFFSMTGVVGGEDHAMPPVGERLHQTKYAVLVSKVEVGARFIQQNKMRPLMQSACDKNKLALSTGQFVEVFVSQVVGTSHAKCFNCIGDI